MKKTLEERVFNAIALTITTLFSLICLFPILLTISGSISSEESIWKGLSIIPQEISFDAYKMIFENPGVVFNAYKVTIIVVIVGTLLSLFMTSMTSYVLYRKDFKYRNIFSFYFFFSTLFSGGLVPSYILMTTLELRNTYAVLVLSGMFSVFNVIIMRTYFSGNIPQALVESAKIDGAGDFRIYSTIILPSAGPIIATVGLITALGYWNSWQPAMLYLDDPDMYPLQYYLQKLFKDAEMANNQFAQQSQQFKTVPSEGYKLAMTVVTIGPIVLLYPFVQKYFVSGVTVGAVKG